MFIRKFSDISEVELDTKWSFFFNLLGDCTCKDLINYSGYGNCQGTVDINRGGVPICYVNQPSTCGDLEDSISNPGEKSSAEACPPGNK